MKHKNFLNKLNEMIPILNFKNINENKYKLDGTAPNLTYEILINKLC